MYNIADFTEVSTDTYAIYTFEVTITVEDEASTEAPNTYTITVNIDNTNHKPYFDGSAEDTVLEGWTVGSGEPDAADMPKILLSYFSDDDSLDTIAFDATYNCAF